MSRRARVWCPEVIQTSVMDCGPAALKCLLEGHGIRASYGRLREACQTDIDGTSIDVIEQTAIRLGLLAEQMMLPLDYLWTRAAHAFPALLVLARSDGFAHFVVAWRRVGAWVLIMDPATGRRWVRQRDLERSLLRHRQRVAVADWLEWGRGDEATKMLCERLQALGASVSDAARFVHQAQSGGLEPLATLDAAQRMVSALVAGRGLRAGPRAIALVESLIERIEQQPTLAHEVIPGRYWAVARPDPHDPRLVLQGVVLIRIDGCTGVEPAADTLSPELAAALAEPSPRPIYEMLTLLRSEGWLTPVGLALAVLVSSATVLLEALLLRGLFDLSHELTLLSQRVGAIAGLLGFVGLLWLLEWPISAETLRLGRQWELRLRQALLRKLPRLPDRYLQSRPISDMAERSHSVSAIRQVPSVLVGILNSGLSLVFTWLGISLIAPASAGIAALIAAIATLLPVLAQHALRERESRLRSHIGALQSFYLDALLGVVPIRAQGAERAIRREHESLVAEWSRAFWHKTRLGLGVSLGQMLMVTALAAQLLWQHLASFGVDGSFLLLAYWALRLPALAQAFGGGLLQLPNLGAIAARLYEPLAAPEDLPAPNEDRVGVELPDAAVAPTPRALKKVQPVSHGVTIVCQELSVIAGGHTLLERVNLSICAGEHLAIVGPSGAGKSSLLGLLLGWHRAETGSLWVDEEALSTQRVAWLRGQTAWVDPAVTLWNRSLLDNLAYASTANLNASFGTVIEQADLKEVVARLPGGLQSPLGEGGGLLSGGEGQRVRLGRALHQNGVRLALLDEPFRGLARTQRQQQMALVRRWWASATLLCVTHDVAATRDFDRVLVIDEGRIVEDGSPADLLDSPHSQYRQMLEAEQALEQDLWQSPEWRRLRVEAGAVHEKREAGRE